MCGLCFVPVTHTLALNKTHNAATQDYPWLHLYIFGAMFTILDCWPCSFQFFSSARQLLRSWTKQQAPKFNQDKCAKVWWRCSAVKSSIDASKQLTLMFTVQIDERKTNTKISRSLSKTFKCLVHVIIWVWQFRLKEVIRDNTLFLWNASKPQNFSLQSYPRQHMIAKCYISWNNKKSI